MRSYLKLIRVEQYIKNTFVFAPLFFSGEFTNVYLLLKTIICFICFCFASSSIYIINDYFDINEDKQHPLKSKRPLASGIISIRNAFLLLIVLLSSTLVIAFNINLNVLTIIAIYIFLNILYSIKLKHIPILDINIIAIGFVLRILAGAFTTSIEPSIWIIIETYLLALFLGLAKRRTDFIMFTDGLKVRKNIDGYNLQFIDITLAILSATIIICYIFYCISPEIQEHYNSNLLFISVIFVFNGLARYLKLAIVDKTTFSPTTIVLKDNFIQIIIICWVFFLSSLLYFNK